MAWGLPGRCSTTSSTSPELQPLIFFFFFPLIVFQNLALARKALYHFSPGEFKLESEKNEAWSGL
jgi:hypothetical protein